MSLDNGQGTRKDKESLNFDVPEEARTERLDKFLANLLIERYSRTRVQSFIRAGRVTVDGKPVPAHYKLNGGERVVVEPLETEENETRGENIPLDIVYEDDDLIIVNKPAGMVVHPACGNTEHTLVNALVYHTRNRLSSLGGGVRAGIVHRLDKDTSGILVVAKTDDAHRRLAKQFKTHKISRVYEVYVKGVAEHDEFRCTEPVGRAFVNRKKVVVKPSGGKDAATNFKVIRRFKKTTVLEAYPETGRTHQIRVHLAFLGYPVLGDIPYGIPSPYIARQALHAKKIGFCHPRTNEWVEFEVEIPEDMRELRRQLATD
ncbi:MAG: RluA family pseudouridine synthase [Candidatus Omnitrophica bacterium]|nr:RluA family pseudouridine synthase [Candidatus Omnitrophota bacterium]